LSRRNNLWQGNLKCNWIYKFHGDSCEFKNLVTNQFLDIKINRNGYYGVIDNFYLFKFIETTEALNYVFEMIKTKEELIEILNELEADNIIINIGQFPDRSRVLNYKAIE
jgi:hypothetical protein